MYSSVIFSMVLLYQIFVNGRPKQYKPLNCGQNLRDEMMALTAFRSFMSFSDPSLAPICLLRSDMVLEKVLMAGMSPTCRALCVMKKHSDTNLKLLSGGVNRSCLLASLSSATRGEKGGEEGEEREVGEGEGGREERELGEGEGGRESRMDFIATGIFQG